MSEKGLLFLQLFEIIQNVLSAISSLKMLVDKSFQNSGRELTIKNRQKIDFVIATFSFFVLVILEGSCPKRVILFAAI